MQAPNRGLQSAGLGQLQWAVRLLEQALPALGASTEPGQAVMKAIQSLAKHVPAGSTSPGVENSALQKTMTDARAEQPKLALMRAMGGGGEGPSAQAA